MTGTCGRCGFFQCRCNTDKDPVRLEMRREANINLKDKIKQLQTENKEIKTIITNKDSYIKRLKRQISNWERKFDRLLELFQKSQESLTNDHK